MKIYILWLFVGLISLSTSAQDLTENKGRTFNGYKELGKYAFGNTNLKDVTNGYLFDYAFGLYDDATLSEILPKDNKTNADIMLGTLKLIEDCDINNEFETDSLLFPFMYAFYAVNGSTPLTIPLIITDMDVSELKPNKREIINRWTSDSPFPQFRNYDFNVKNVFNASFFCDTFVYNNIQLYWTDELVVSNTEREVEHIYITAQNQTFEIEKSIPYNINHLFDINRPLTKMNISIEFSDGTKKTVEQNIYLKKGENAGGVDEIKATSQGSGEIIGNPLIEYSNLDNFVYKLEYETYFGCEDEIIDKPYIIISGWGAFTDKDKYNNNYNLDTDTFEDIYAKQNIEGLIDQLIEQNFDVILVRFRPPNASILTNIELLIEFINLINDYKNNNGSYEELVIHGQSSGALVAKLALLKMEYEHLNNNGPHHQTKLFISHDGEHQGANIPLGMQGSVKYLHNYAAMVPFVGANKGKYILHFILNAYQTKELLKYHYSYPQSNTPERQDYLNAHIAYNHNKNNHIPGYPSFCRNISASNGIPISQITGNNSNHLPYPTQEGFVFYGQVSYNIWGNEKQKIIAKLSTANQGTPFLYKKRVEVGGGMVILYQIQTNNQPNLDNAPGGSMFEDKNPQYQILKLFMADINTNEQPPYTQLATQYCFTPIIYTHDIKNFNPADHNYQMEYNFFRERLMFQTPAQAANYNGTILADNDLKITNYYGYPHLGLPNNHYQITPFDALFCSNDRNTEHLTFNEANGIPDASLEGEAIYNPSLRGEFKNWIIYQEADCFHTYIQNRKYGDNARSNYLYKAHFNSPHTINIGNHVTNRTDFKDVEVLDNAELICKAEEKITIKPGFKTLPGAKFVAKIQPYNCSTTKATINQNPYLGSAENNNNSTQPNATNVDSNGEVILYPNPNTGTFTIKTPNNLAFNYKIYNLQGKVLKYGSEEMTSVINTQLPQGVYMVTVTVKQQTTVHKLVIH